ncbi:hypothetical protein OSTOST_15236 [Ostertagia ostertagi]
MTSLNEKKEHIKKLEEELVALQIASSTVVKMKRISMRHFEQNDGRQYQEEIRALHEQVREVKEELERSMEECEEWKGRFETSEREKEEKDYRVRDNPVSEEHHRFRDAAAEEKKKLLELTEEQRYKVEELQEEVNEYKGKLKEAETVTAAEVERYEAARARLAEEYEEMKASLRNIQGVSKTAVDKSQEENFAVRIKQQLEELEKDKTARLQEMAAEHRAHQERLEKRIEDMEAARVEQIKELGKPETRDGRAVSETLGRG